MIKQVSNTNCLTWIYVIDYAVAQTAGVITCMQELKLIPGSSEIILYNTLVMLYFSRCKIKQK